LRQQGWSISAIARHLGRDRKTVRAYLNGQRAPGQRVRSQPDQFAPFLDYCRLRLADDPHLWATTLYDEITELGYRGGYSSFTRALRTHRLRPHCEPCAAAKGRDVAIIAHPPGEETQFDWLELPDAPAAWGWGRDAHLLVGALSASGLWRGVLAESEDFPHLIEALDAVVRRLGGVSRRWRFDRMATVCYPASGKLTAAVRSEQPPRVWRVSDRLGEADICSLVSGYRAGTTARELAEQFNISKSSVKNLLRERGVRRMAPTA
jgi:transposase